MRTVKTISKAADASNGNVGMFFGILILGLVLAFILYIVVKDRDQ